MRKGRNRKFRLEQPPAFFETPAKVLEMRQPYYPPSEETKGKATRSEIISTAGQLQRFLATMPPETALRMNRKSLSFLIVEYIDGELVFS